MMQSAKPKLLILVDWFYPGYKAGGPIQSVLNLIYVLKDKYEIHILTTDTDHGETKPYENIVTNEWLFSEELEVNLFYAQKKSLVRNVIKKQIQFIDPDFVYLNHLFSPLFVIYPLWLKFAGKINAKMVVCPRGALYDSALSIKAYKKKPLLFIFKMSGIFNRTMFHATNHREQAAIEQYFPGAPILIADNLPDCHQKDFVSIPKFSGELKCLFVSRIVPIKNLSFILEFLQEVKSKIHFTVAGPIEDNEYWELCQSKIKQLPANIKVEYVGSVAKKEIVDLIISHHLFILPTKGENFGHAIFESFSAGRPVLISDQTPWLSLADSFSGWDLPLNDKNRFSTVIEQMAGFDQEQFDIHAKGAWQLAHRFIDKSLLQHNYFKLFS